MADPTASKSTTARSAGAGSVIGGSGSGGGTTITRDLHQWVYQLVDTKVAASEDRIMRHVVEKTTDLEKQLFAQISGLNAAITQIKPGASWWQIALLLAGAIGTVFAVLAYASDRFDGGLAAGGIRDEILKAQENTDRLQNQRIDKVIELLEARPPTPPTGN